jgi:hypothetical protein
MATNPLQRTVYSLLAANNALSVQVSGRFYPEARAQAGVGTQGNLPSIIYSVNEDEPMVAMNGAIQFHEGVVEILILANTALTAADTANLVLPVLHNRKNVSVTGGGTGQAADTALVMFSRLEKQITGYLAPQNGENTGVFTHSMLFRVMYRENISAGQEA